MKNFSSNAKNKKMVNKIQAEYNEMRKLGEKAGIEDLISLYEGYQKWLQISAQYLKEMDVRFTFCTSDSTS